MKYIIFALILVLVFSFSAFAQTEKMPCPTIEVVGGGVVKPGEPMNFSIKTSDEIKNLKLEYEWIASQGIIASGQGTASITIDSTGLAGGTNITATVKIKGLSDNCADTASEIGSVLQMPICRCEIDEFGKLPNDEVKARMDGLFFTLGNEPNGQGYILNYGTDEEIAVREKQIQKAINFRQYDANCITNVRCGANPNGEGVWTKIFIIPPGVDFPQC